MSEPPDASGRRSHLLHQAGNKKAIGLGAGVTGVSRLPPVSAQFTLGDLIDRSKEPYA
jgi:hypothetical protein